MGIFFKWNIEKGIIMLTNSRRIDTNGLPLDRGFLSNSQLPDQQDYKCRPRGGGGIGTLGIYLGMVIKLSLNNYLRFDSCKIVQVRGQIKVHFHLLGLQYKGYKFHSIHIYFPSLHGCQCFSKFPLWVQSISTFSCILLGMFSTYKVKQIFIC